MQKKNVYEGIASLVMSVLLSESETWHTTATMREIASHLRCLFPDVMSFSINHFWRQPSSGFVKRDKYFLIIWEKFSGFYDTVFIGILYSKLTFLNTVFKVNFEWKYKIIFFFH